jgi:hypothetical protein
MNIGDFDFDSLSDFLMIPQYIMYPLVASFFVWSESRLGFSATAPLAFPSP